jgi:hypothetical protein
MPASRTDRPATLRSVLSGGRPLEKGRACEVADLVVEQPRKLGALIECLWDDDPGVANRAADALERVTARKPPGLDPRLLAPWKESLLGLLADAQPNKLRWNLALTIPRMELTVADARRAAAALRGYLDNSSSIVKTAAMHGLAGLTRHDPSLLPEVLDLVRILSRSGTPAMRARGRILLGKLESGGKKPPRGARSPAS